MLQAEFHWKRPSTHWLTFAIVIPVLSGKKNPGTKYMLVGTYERSWFQPSQSPRPKELPYWSPEKVLTKGIPL